MIYTFYSYKGGVGRTHLLANIATYLCYYRKRKVLLVDWDLEAPGLHFYFKKNAHDANSANLENKDISSKGLIDLLNKHIDIITNIEKGKKFTETDFVNPFDAEEKYTQTLVSAENGGQIDLMPAIHYHENYHTEVEDFDWIKFYDQLYGGNYLLWLKKELKKKYDYVLIDSRTGFNDYSGICNVLMPDMNLILVAPNRQNFNGAKKMIHRIIEAKYTKSKARKGLVLPILSRLDVAHPEVDIWRANFYKEFAFVLSEFDENLPDNKEEIFAQIAKLTTINYETNYALGENLYFRENAELIVGSTSEVFQFIALAFLEELNNSQNRYENSKSYPTTNPEINLQKIATDKQKVIYLNNTEHNPEDFKSWLGLGYIYVKEENFLKAKEAFQKITKLHPTFWEAWHNLGYTYVSLQKYEEAIESYQRAIEIKPNNWRSLISLGNIYSGGIQKFGGLKETKKAIKFYKEAIKINPNISDVYFNLGNIYAHLKQHQNAIDVYLEAVKINPDFYQCWFNLGNSYRIGLKDYDNAISSYQKALEIRNDLPQAWYNLGLTYAQLENYAEARKSFQKVIEIKPDYEDAWNNLGNVYFNLENYAEAIKAYEKAIEIKADDEFAWYNLGVVYTKLKNYEEAIKSYQKALEIKPDDEIAWNNLGVVYFIQGKMQEAKPYFEKTLSSPHSQMNLAHLYLTEKKRAKALELYQESLANFESKEKFFEGMEEDYQYLEKQGVSKEVYEGIIAQLKAL